jgi:hypothetical protein
MVERAATVNGVGFGKALDALARATSFEDAPEVVRRVLDDDSAVIARFEALSDG